MDGNVVVSVNVLPGGAAPEPQWRAFASALVTLTLGILGSSVLPVPWAISRTGVVPGLLISLAVALSNAYTGCLILQAAGHFGRQGKNASYEGVAEAAGGSPAWRIVSQAALVALLFGTMAGDAALLADTGTEALMHLTDGAVPRWVAGGGRIPMLALIILLVTPLSLRPKMRQLERAAAAGSILVVVLTTVIASSALAAHMPAVANGQLPIWGVAVRGELPQAVAVLGFAFYTQPMLLPLLSEMPAGREGVQIMQKAVWVVTAGIALAVYCVIGVFGAARWGQHTQGDILVNKWLPGRLGGALDASIAVYLSISMAPMAITLRYLLDSLVGDFGHFSWRRDTAFTVGGIAAATGVAMACPQAAEQLFAVTGASAVCLVSYVLPVAVHLKLFLRGWQRREWWRIRRRAGAGDPSAWLLEDAAMLEAPPDVAGRRESSVLPTGVASAADAPLDGEQEGDALKTAMPYPSWRDLAGEGGWWAWAGKVALHLVVPLVVLVCGVAVSVLALVLSVRGA